MSESKCGLCGAELLTAASFCRQCGAAVADTRAPETSEATTALFGDRAETATTQRLDPRPTSPERGLRHPGEAVSTGSSGRRKAVVVGFVLVLIIVGILTTVAVMRMRDPNASADSTTLIYPGAQTVVDMANPDGSRTLQLKATAPLARVESWYQTNIKLSKTMRLTSTNVVMKNNKLTITLAEENGVTNILVKQLP
jgi:hypothetical protein